MSGRVPADESSHRRNAADRSRRGSRRPTTTRLSGGRMFDHAHQDNLVRDGGPDASDAARPIRPDLTIVVPTRNEAENIGPLLHRLTEVAGARRIEVLFVDDSEDNTPEEVHERSLRASIP